MIKRPLVWIGFSYILGCLLHALSLYVIGILLFIILLSLNVIYYRCSIENHSQKVNCVKKENMEEKNHVEYEEYLSELIKCNRKKLKIIMNINNLIRKIKNRMRLINNITLSRNDRFILLLPIIILVGYAQMNQAKQSIPFDSLFDREWEGMLTGKISQIEEKENSISYYLKNCNIYLNPETKNPIKKQIIVYVNKEKAKEENKEYAIGNRLKVYGTVNKLMKPTNEGQFNSRDYYQAKGVKYIVYAERMDCIDRSKSWYMNKLLNLKKSIGKVYEIILPTEEAGIIKAMILGEKNTLDTSIKQLYQKNGIAHILAISGLHISFLSMVLYKLMKKVGLPLILNTIFVTFIVISYGKMTNFSVSTNRAVVMFLVSLFAIVIGRIYDMLSAISLSACIILTQNPMQLYQPGFQLSFIAVLVIAISMPLMEANREEAEKNEEENTKKSLIVTLLNINIKGKIISKLYLYVKSKRIDSRSESFMLRCYEKGRVRLEDYLDSKRKLNNSSAGKAYKLSLMITAATTPIVASTYYEISLYSVLLNLLIIPLMSILLILGVLAGGIGLYVIPVAKIIGKGIIVVLKLYDVLCRLCSKLPFHLILIGKPYMIQIIIYYLVAFLIIGISIKKKKRFLIGFLAFLWVILLRYPDSNLTMTMLDVSQGDCMHIRTPQGTNMLIDGGSLDVKDIGMYRIMPYLKANRVGVLDYVALTHMDADHINGILQLLEEMPSCKKNNRKKLKSKKCEHFIQKSRYSGHIIIRNIILPKTSMIDDTYQKIEQIALEKGVQVLYFGKGDYLKEGILKIRCLHPYYEYVSNSLNNTSLVFNIEYKKFKALLLGDLEGEGEKELIKLKQQRESDYVPLYYDFIKIAHHGSKYSSIQTFLSEYHAYYGLISCGYGNRFGHPAKEVLDRLKDSGIDALTTMKQGSITFVTNGKKILKIIK